jgi:hypothetical protein
MRVNVQQPPDTVQRLSEGARPRARWLPAACGIFGFGLVLFVWGSLTKASIGSDEAAYLLQARIFASGRLVADARPLPEFFQQFHVFVTPVLAGKYPPGHALLLTLGIWLGMPGLVPALTTAITCVVLCVLAQRFADDLTAALTVGLATTSGIALRFNPSYFSETTTAMALVVGWWAILRYSGTDRARWLALWGAASALGAITRPMTMLACEVPMLIVVAGIVGRRRSWKHLLPAVPVAAFILGFSATGNARVTGHWYKLPWAEYARLYMPSDRLGFGASPNKPAAQLTADEAASDELLRQFHAHYTIRDVPAAAADRAANIIRGTWSYGGVPALAILVAAGLVPIAVLRLTVGTVLSVFVAYLFFAQDPSWTLYYLELQAPLGFLTAVGLVGATRSAVHWAARHRPTVGANRPVIGAVALGLVIACLGVPAIARILGYRHAHAAYRQYHERFLSAVASLPSPRSIVFVHYAPGHGEEKLVENVPDLATAPVWVAHDCGGHNSALTALAPERVPYLYRESRDSNGFSFTISRLGEAPTEEQAC